MLQRILRVISRLLIRIERSALLAEIEQLRRNGHSIARNIILGRRIQIDVFGSGKLSIGECSEILHDSWIIVEDTDMMNIGRNVFISQHCTISGSITIGDSTLIAGYVTILDANHIFDDPNVPIREQGGRKKSIEIGSDVWIGASSVILPGVRIGDHAVIGANTTVSKDIPAWAVVAGTPARILRYRDH